MIYMYIIYHDSFFSNLQCYLFERGNIYTRPKVIGKCALAREDNIADMKKPMM